MHTHTHMHARARARTHTQKTCDDRQTKIHAKIPYNDGNLPKNPEVTPYVIDRKLKSKTQHICKTPIRQTDIQKDRQTQKQPCMYTCRKKLTNIQTHTEIQTEI